MYFVDRQKLEERLTYLEQLFHILEEQAVIPTSRIDMLASERAIHMTIEAILDVGNQMIDGFIMRDPGSYEDIIDILKDEQVIEEKEAGLLVTYIQLRKLLVTQYTQEPFEHIWAVYKSAAPVLAFFPKRVRDYLHDQLGPVSAFIPSSEG